MHTPLGLRLKEIRAGRGLSLRDAAKETGVDRDTIREIELGERHPFPRTLGKLASGYGIPIRELLVLEEPLGAGKDAAPPAGHSGTQDGLEGWLKEHDAARILLSDDEVLQSLEGLVEETPLTTDVTDVIAQEMTEAFAEEAKVEAALVNEWVRGSGDLLPTQDAFARHKEYTRIKRELRGRYERFYRALEAFNRALFAQGETGDFVMFGSTRRMEAKRAAAQALQRERAGEASGEIGAGV
jgi:transcriptional regulator with XRE-family HTH domain